MNGFYLFFLCFKYLNIEQFQRRIPRCLQSGVWSSSFAMAIPTRCYLSFCMALFVYSRVYTGYDLFCRSSLAAKSNLSRASKQVRASVSVGSPHVSWFYNVFNVMATVKIEKTSDLTMQSDTNRYLENASEKVKPKPLTFLYFFVPKLLPDDSFSSLKFEIKI
jgi:hypothetical protein